MSFLDRARNKLEEVFGDVKETFGEATGNQALEVSGEAEADAARQREAEEEAEAAAARGSDATGDSADQGRRREDPAGNADPDGPDDDDTDDDGRGGVLVS